ncbi:MAG: hypothetical protein ACI97N_002280 [Cognaticolwellia sp.]|jgi:hypothetical protein
MVGRFPIPDENSRQAKLGMTIFFRFLDLWLIVGIKKIPQSEPCGISNKKSLIIITPILLTF